MPAGFKSEYPAGFVGIRSGTACSFRLAENRPGLASPTPGAALDSQLGPAAPAAGSPLALSVFFPLDMATSFWGS